MKVSATLITAVRRLEAMPQLRMKTVMGKAQEALSHSDVATTIGSYVDPRVVVNFLANGGLDDSLEDILVRNKNVKVLFNFEAFLGQTKVASNVVGLKETERGGVSVLDVMREMDDLLGGME